MEKEPYTILKVKKQASESDIKTNFRKLAKKHHPDKGGTPEKFELIRWAYTVLKDPKTRKAYDETGELPDEKEEHFIKNSARENLIRLIKEILSNNDFILNFKTTDLINFFHSTIDNQKVNSIQNIETSKERVTFLTELNSRVSVKDKSSSNLVNLIIKSELEQHEEQLQILKRSIKIFDEMKKLIDNYEYDFDQAVATFTNTDSTSNWSSTRVYFT